MIFFNTFIFNYLWCIKIETQCSFESRKLSMIDYVLNVATIFSSSSIYKFKETVRTLSFILLQSIVLTLLMFENACVIIAVEIEKVIKYKYNYSMKEIVWTEKVKTCKSYILLLYVRYSSN